MISGTRLESWSRPAEREGPAGTGPHLATVVAVAACLLFLGAWALLHEGFYDRGQIVDTPVYENYGDATLNGRVPYRDFGVEYPPGALPALVLPALGNADDGGESDAFRRNFEGLMALFGLGTVLGVVLVLRAAGADPRRLAAAAAFAALAPLALGSVVLSRFDLWPAFLTVLALAALTAGRLRLGSGLLGAGVAVKVFPGVLLPLALAHAWRRRGRREALACLGVFAAVVAAAVLPFLLVAPGGVWDAVARQTGRPLQLESLGSALLLAAHHGFGLDLTMKSSHGSQNLSGTLPAVVGVAQTLVQLAALAAIWAWYARGPAERERLLRAAALALVAFVALGKVLSPQFLIWLIPLVPLVRGRRGLVASGLLSVALVLTQLWFPYRYWDFALSFDETASWLVLVRDLVLLGLLASLAWPCAPTPRSEPGPARS